ncbi:MAG: nucleoside hydrolase, partial [candidate division KSB1 bacterium]|nr:nucleoside hydrolase [candidate division KSB1 bacterium]
MKFPSIPESVRLERLQPPQGKIRLVIDSDTYNEIDDQFAITYPLLSPERLEVEAIYAAPFFNERSTDPG